MMFKLTGAQLRLLQDVDAGARISICTELCDSFDDQHIEGRLRKGLHRKTLYSLKRYGYVKCCTRYHLGIRWETFELTPRGKEVLDASNP